MTEIATSIQTAENLKQQGKEHFDQRDYQRALALYSKIPLHLKQYEVPKEYKNLGIPQQQDQQEQPDQQEQHDENKAKIKQLLLSSYVNCAICVCKLSPINPSKKRTAQHQARLLGHVAKALELDPKNAKALFHRGSLYLQQGELDLAEPDLLEAAKQHPDAVRKQLEVLQEKKKAAHQKQKKEFAGIFNRMAAKEADSQDILSSYLGESTKDVLSQHLPDRPEKEPASDLVSEYLLD